MQSVNIRVPGLESSISSGEVNTLPVTSSKWIVSVGEGQKLVWESVEGTTYFFAGSVVHSLTSTRNIARHECSKRSAEGLSFF